MNLLNIYSIRLTEKRYTKKQLLGLVVHWFVFIILFTIPLLPWQITTLAIIVGVFNIIPVLYQLKKGIYLAPGETYKKSSTETTEEFLDKVKNGKK